MSMAPILISPNNATQPDGAVFTRLARAVSGGVIQVREPGDHVIVPPPAMPRLRHCRTEHRFDGNCQTSCQKTIKRSTTLSMLMLLTRHEHGTHLDLT